MSIKVSVVIPTYNRFDYLLNAVNSIKDQNFSDFEILIINDGSTDENYYENKLSGTNIKQIDLEENQKIKNGFASDAIRNIGIESAKGKYIAFLDDDDIWLSNKINKQYKLLESSENKMSSTEGLFGFGIFNSKTKYKLFNEEYYFKTISKKYKNTKYFKKNFIFNKFDYPKIFDLSFIDIHNCIITSSVMIERELLIDVGMFDPTLKNGVGDYDCWLKVLEYTNCDYIADPLFYYDGSHGQGQNYK